ncbi:uncharacterized protein TNCV_1854791 [Trichonephila clavipes]|nr:uncharacterized protein TNCV_1854791 [Trichonephila clavipes]
MVFGVEDARLNRTSFIRTSFFVNLEGEKGYNDDHRDDITDFSPISIRGFQECDKILKFGWQSMQKKDSQWISNVTSVQAESNPVDDETDEDEDNESSKGPSNAGAFSSLETAMECCPTQENLRPCSEKMKMYNGTTKNK